MAGGKFKAIGRVGQAPGHRPRPRPTAGMVDTAAAPSDAVPDECCDALDSKDFDRGRLDLTDAGDAVTTPAVGVPDTEQCAAAKEPEYTEEVVYALACAACRGEKFVLCVGDDLMQDEVNSNPACGSYFLQEAKAWMDETACDIEGKLKCPACSTRVGRISWVGFEAVRGRWISPAIMLTRSKVDIQVLSKQTAAQAGLLEADDPGSASNGEGVSNGEDVGASAPQQDVDARCAVEAEADAREPRQGAAAEEMSPGDGVKPAPQDGPGDTPVRGEHVSQHHSKSGASPGPSLPCAHAGDKGSNPAQRRALELSDDEINTMDMTELARLIETGRLDMDRMMEAMDRGAAKKKEQERRMRDLSDPKCLVASLKEELPDTEDLKAFKEASGRLGRGEITCEAYFTGLGPRHTATLKALALSTIGADIQGGPSLLEAALRGIPNAALRAEALALSSLTFRGT